MPSDFKVREHFFCSLLKRFFSMCVTEAIGRYSEEENMGYLLAQQRVAMLLQVI